MISMDTKEKLHQLDERIRFEEQRAALAVIAKAMNSRYPKLRWQLMKVFTEELQRYGLPFAFFDHGGFVDVGEFRGSQFAALSEPDELVDAGG